MHTIVHLYNSVTEAPAKFNINYEGASIISAPPDVIFRPSSGIPPCFKETFAPFWSIVQKNKIHKHKILLHHSQN